MSWRTVILTKESKLSLRMEHLMISSDTVVKIPLNEIAILMIENPNIVLTGHIINALSSYKIATIICDSKMNPSSIIHSVYGHHRQSKHIRQQVEWTSDRKGILWQQITKQKILNQSKLLMLLNQEGAEELKAFIEQVDVHDVTNREVRVSSETGEPLSIFEYRKFLLDSWLHLVHNKNTNVCIFNFPENELDRSECEQLFTRISGT